jgi:predicted DCC family thiol-disulfide oxidoreductase YuxK
MLNLPNKKKLFSLMVYVICATRQCYLLSRDLNDVFRFVALQSKVGQEICNYIGVDPIKWIVLFC